MTTKITIHALTINVGAKDTSLPDFLGVLQFAPQTAKAEAARFTTAHDGAATIDVTTGLMWSTATIGDSVDHAKAINAAEGIRIGGHTDWRLPTRAELASLIDDTRHDPAIDITAFPDTKSSYYWTSTSVASSSGCAWIVAFYRGGVYYSRRNYKAFVRAVRSAAPASQ